MNTYLFMFRSNLYWKYIPGGKFAQEKRPQIHCFLRVQAFLTWVFFKFYQLNKLWREERNCVWPKLESRFMMLKKITGKGSSLTISLSQSWFQIWRYINEGDKSFVLCGVWTWPQLYYPLLVQQSNHHPMAIWNRKLMMMTTMLRISTMVMVKQQWWKFKFEK